MYTVLKLNEGFDDILGLREWAEDRFSCTLLILGDATAPLQQFANFSVAIDESTNAIKGILVEFTGFNNPIISFVAVDEMAAKLLLETVNTDSQALLAVSANQEWINNTDWVIMDEDLWLTTNCDNLVLDHKAVHEISDEKELALFFKQNNIEFWLPSMLDYGYAYGIRNADNELVSFVGINFIIPTRSYAQIGSLVTAPQYRGAGFASILVNTVKSKLAKNGIKTCGLFADSKNAQLQKLYKKLQFTAQGGFNFYTRR